MRYKTTYSKSTSLFSSTTWFCYIYDRKNQTETLGSGSTKDEAYDDAQNLLWQNKNDSNDNSYSSPYVSPPRKISPAERLKDRIIKVISLIGSISLFYWQYNVFEASKDIITVKAIGAIFFMFVSAFCIIAVLIDFIIKYFKSV